MTNTPPAVNIHDVAAAAGVSIATASRALNNIGRVSVQTRKNVLEAARRLDYRIKNAQANPFALILPSLQTNLGMYSTMLINAMRHEAAARGNSLLMLSREDFKLLREDWIAGIISMDYLEEVGRELPKHKNLPLVCLNDPGNHLDNVFSVVSDEEQGMRLALEYLFRLNHHRIGLLLFRERREIDRSRLRKNAFLDIMTEYGLKHHAFVQEFSLELDFHEAVGMLLRQDVSALLVAGEDNCNSLRSLALYGRRIPEDISLIGWEFPHARNFLPRLTSLSQDLPAIAAAAFDMLDRQIARDTTLSDIKIPYLLCERESCAPRMEPELSPD